MASLAVLTLLGVLSVGNGLVETPGESHGSCQPDEGISKILTFLNFVIDITKEAKQIVEGHKITGGNLPKPMDCAELVGTGQKSGLHKIWPRNRVVQGPVDVMCDMDDDGGGWTVIQRRGDFNSSKEYFFRDWNSYKTGFGNLNKDFWIGNDVIFALTNQRPSSIKFVLTDWDGNTVHAIYDDFWLDDEINKYTLHVSGYRGTAGDSFSYHNGDPFTTKDRMNNENPSNCALDFKGAWWYKKCHESNLNGLYHKGAHESFADGVNWKAFKEYKYSLKDTFMKIRPKKMEQFT